MREGRIGGAQRGDEAGHDVAELGAGQRTGGREGVQAAVEVIVEKLADEVLAPRLKLSC